MHSAILRRVSPSISSLTRPSSCPACRAQVRRCEHPCDRVIEHPAKCDTVDITRMYAESDEPACELIQDDHNPMVSERQRLAAKEVYAPHAVFCML